jgi:hypothetical protein
MDSIRNLECDSGIAIRRISLMEAVVGSVRQSCRNILHFVWLLPLALQALGWANSFDPGRQGIGRFEVKLRPLREWTFDSGELPSRSHERGRFVVFGALEFDQFEWIRYEPQDCPLPAPIPTELRGYFPHPW